MEKNRNPFVEIIGVTLGIFMVITIMFLIFANSVVETLIPISWAFMVVGIIAIVFQYRLLSSEKDKKK